MSEYPPRVLPNQPDFGSRGPGQKNRADCCQFDRTCEVAATMFAPPVGVTGASWTGFFAIGAVWLCWHGGGSTGPLRLGGGVIGDLACDRIDARHDPRAFECEDSSRTSDVLAVIVAKTEKRLNFWLCCFRSAGGG